MPWTLAALFSVIFRWCQHEEDGDIFPKGPPVLVQEQGSLILSRGTYFKCQPKDLRPPDGGTRLSAEDMVVAIDGSSLDVVAAVAQQVHDRKITQAMPRCFPSTDPPFPQSASSCFPLNSRLFQLTYCVLLFFCPAFLHSS